MSISEQLLQPQASPEVFVAPAVARAELAELLRQSFDTPWAMLDGTTGELLADPPALPRGDWAVRGEICRQVAERGVPEFIAEEGPLLMLALPLDDDGRNVVVAVAAFLTRPIEQGEDLDRAAAALGASPAEAAAWAVGRNCWSPRTLLNMARLVREQWRSRQRIDKLQHEAASLSVNLSNTYEEISLLHRLTQNLHLSKSDADLGRIALEWLDEVLPAEGLALQLLPAGAEGQGVEHVAAARRPLIVHGRCPVDEAGFAAMIEHLAAQAIHRPVVVNRTTSSQAGWPCPGVRQVVIAGLTEGENLFGWLAALNHRDNAEFGTVEANLLSSVAAILGIHSGNIELYRQQSELMAGIIRALTSAIDAKDPYTCGHSDRVARIAVRLAEELGCDAETRNTIYLAGLLHDIGKIGVNDDVLRKPGKLTDEEYEHIKRHTEIGHRILLDLKQLDNVLPVVLHHHESWDGRGYPEQLTAETIPLAARIVAVADSFDAMSSDRPYRKGMPDEKIDAIFRGGSGQQWDPRVVDAFFSARDDIQDIAHGQAQAAETPACQPVCG